MQGHVLQVQRFCIHDGPGVRTTVFLKGCPLRCAWCHNPESQRFGPEISYFAAQCLGCQACAVVCPKQGHRFADGMHEMDRSQCIHCGQCAAVCVGALEVIGRAQSVEEVMQTVRQDMPFYGEKGGLTVSGGEPLSQPEFTAELLRAAKAEGIHTCVETSGFASEKAIRTVAKACDLFLYDVKHMDDEQHKKWTGVSNEIILHNLSLLNDLQKPVSLRCILLPEGQNDAHWQGVAGLLHRYPVIREVHILPYHVFGTEKAERTGGTPHIPFAQAPDAEMVRARVEWLRSKTAVPIMSL